MNRHILIWGWIRLALSFSQIFFSTAGILLLVMVGQEPITWFCIIAATVSTIVSRALYHGRRDPRLNSEKRRDQRS